METATEGRLTDHLATVLGARYASALARWDGETTDEFHQKLKVLRGMCQDIVELRRGNHSGSRLKMERERMEEKREKTEDEIVAKFEEWAQNQAVKDWIYQDWIPPKERKRRLREILGLPPLPGDEVEETASPDDVARQKEMEKIQKLRQIFGLTPAEEAVEPDLSKKEQTGPEAPGSNPVKVSQTTLTQNQSVDETARNDQEDESRDSNGPPPDT